MKKIILLLSIFLKSASMFSQCTDLIISKYFRYSGNTKAIEFYNASNSPINLTSGHYVLERYKAVSALGVIDNILDDSLHLAGVVPSHSTWVVVNGQTAANSSATSPQPDTSLQQLANQLDKQYGTYGPSIGQPLYFKGNDCLVLRKNGVIIDVFGEVNNTVTTAWSSIAPYRGASGMGKWITTGYLMVRKPNVLQGRIPPITNDLTSFTDFNPLAEYDTIPKILSSPTPTRQDTLNMFAHFGSHTCDCNCGLIINQQPTNQTVNIGSTALFSLASNTASNATYQWQSNIGFGFQNLSNAGQYTGVTNDTLLVNNVSMTNNNQAFRCLVNTINCNDISNEVVLNINTTTSIVSRESNTVSIYPNPTSSSFEILNAMNKSVTILSPIGNTVCTYKLRTNQEKIDVGNVSKGIYIIKLIDERDNTESYKLILE